MTESLVSILVVTYNHAPFIERALASIAAQRTEFGVEVVVADDGSTDGTRELVMEWGTHQDFPVRVLESNDRLGITLNYDRGFRECNGEYIAVLEGDDEWLSFEKLQLQAAVLRDEPHLSMVSSRVLLYDESTNRASVIPLIGNDSFLTEIRDHDLAASNFFATFSACMYRADSLSRIAPDVFETTAYDWLVNMAVTQFGPAGLLPQVLSLYRLHRGGQWSNASVVSRNRQIQALIPRYVELLGPSVSAELTRALRSIETQLSMVSEEAVRSDPVVAVPIPETAPVPIPYVRVSPKPRVSVVMASYNHGPYILEAIDSVLDQTIGDLELVIVDDCSSDDSLTRLALIDDPRVRIYALESNQGGAAALNIAIQQSRSDLIAVLNSDDVWELSKLGRQLEVFEESPEIGAVFTGARFIAEDGSALPPSRIPPWSQVFRQPARTQAQWLRFMFESGNVLCHPSVLIKKDMYRRYGLYDNRLRQIPDLKMWITLVKHYPIVVLGDEELVRFRLLPAEQNASSQSRANVVRNYREHLDVAESFFEGCEPELLIEAFGEFFRDQMARTTEELAIEVALLQLFHACAMQSLNKVEGLRSLRRLLGTSSSALLLKTHYGLDDHALHELSKTEDALPELELMEKLQFSFTVPPSAVLDATTLRLAWTLIERVRAVPLTALPRRVAGTIRRAANTRRSRSRTS
jgi:glycosyltransferase involved in cell wall biosynthesis